MLKAILAAAAAVLTIAAFWPGYMSVDSAAQLEQARYGIRDTGHPPLLSILWRPVDSIIPGPGGMLAVQAGLYWLGVALLSPSAAWLLAGLLPPLAGVTGVVWKDVWMFVTLLVAVGWLARGRAWAGLAFLLLATGLRHNGILAVVPLLWPAAGILARKRGWRAWPVFVALMIVFIAAARVLTQPPGIPDPKLWRLSLAHDVAGISLRANQDFFPPGFLASQGLTLDTLRRIHVPYQMDPTFTAEHREVFGIRGEPDLRIDAKQLDAGEIWRAWLTAVRQRPGAWLSHRAAISERLLVLKPEYAWMPVHTGIVPNALGIEWKPDWRSRFLDRRLNDLSRNTPLYQVWIYVLLLGAAAVLFRRHALIAATAWSGLLTAGAMCVLAGTCDYRYMLWPVAAAAAVCLLAGSEWVRRQRQSSSSSQS